MGPALKQIEAHRLIHMAAFTEAMDLWKMARSLCRQGDPFKARLVVEVFLEHWESRTLRHAEEEEGALYPLWISENPALEPTVSELRDQHEAMRGLLERIKTSVSNLGHFGMLGLMGDLMRLSAKHIRREEALLTQFDMAGGRDG